MPQAEQEMKCIVMETATEKGLLNKKNSWTLLSKRSRANRGQKESRKMSDRLILSNRLCSWFQIWELGRAGL